MKAREREGEKERKSETERQGEREREEVTTKYKTVVTNSTAYKSEHTLGRDDRCTLLSIMIAFLPYLGYAKYKNYKV